MTSVALQHHSMLIGGRDVDTERHREIVDPSNGDTVATVAHGNAGHVDDAVAAARATFESGVWRHRTPQERAAVMRRIVAAANDAAEELVELELSANGATVRQATGFHIGYALAHFSYFADLAETYAWQRPAPITSFPALGQAVVHREPIGVVGAIAPWNFPLLLTLWKVGPALAAGNSVVVKPDEHTPLSILAFARIAEANGLPPGVLNVVTGDGPDAGARLAGHPDVGKIAFTGSTAVGREIMRLAAGTVKQVTLELGGKGPSIVLDDADLDLAVDGVLYGCFVYSGQICESGTRALVPASLHDEFVSRLVARATTITMGPTRDWDTDMGPVINGRQQSRILDHIRAAVAEGAVVALGGEALDQPGFWVTPTILTGVRNAMRIAREEVFGPVLSVLTFRTEDEAIELANNAAYGLSAGVWSLNVHTCLNFARKVRAGTVWTNTWMDGFAELPFGGVKESGLGRELGRFGIEEYLELKTVQMRVARGRNSWVAG